MKSRDSPTNPRLWISCSAGSTSRTGSSLEAATPRDILHHIRSIATFEGSEPSLDPSILHRAAHAYFLVMEEEIQAGVSSISSNR